MKAMVESRAISEPSWIVTLLLASLLSVSCAASPPKQMAGCALTRFADDTRLADPSVDLVTGSYKRGTAVITVRRKDYRFLIDIPGSSVRETAMIGPWRFQDGCGALYEFSLPMNGVGASLRITGAGGVVSEWRRGTA